MTKGKYRKELANVHRWVRQKGWTEGFSSVTLLERLDYLVEQEAKKKAKVLTEDLTKKNDELQFAVWAMAHSVGLTPQDFTLEKLQARVRDLADNSK